jgi:hypothetical protein
MCGSAKACAYGWRRMARAHRERQQLHFRVGALQLQAQLARAVAPVPAREQSVGRESCTHVHSVAVATSAHAPTGL